jgi:hypothetical protein
MTIDGPHAPTIACDGCRYVLHDDDGPQDPISRVAHLFQEDPALGYDIIERRAENRTALWVRMTGALRPRRYHRALPAFHRSTM